MSIKKTKTLLIILAIGIFVTGLLHKFHLIQHQVTQVDEIYVLARTCNNSIYSKSPDFNFAETKLYSLKEINQAFQPKFKKNNFFQDAAFYLKNYKTLSNHPPIPEILTKLTIINGKTNITKLRILSFCYFLITLFVLYRLYRKMQLTKLCSLWSLAIFSSLSLSSLVFTYPKNYALWILTSIICFNTFIDFLKNNKLQNGFLSLFCFHIAFQTHYFSAMILPFFYYIFILKFKARLSKWFMVPILYISSLIIYFPIIKQQKSFTSKYFDSFKGCLWELKSFLKTIITIFGFNFKDLFAIIICLYLLYWFIKKINKNKIYFLILTVASTIVVLSYDCFLNHHMVDIFRYSSLSLIFLPVILFKIMPNKILLSMLLITSSLFPNLLKNQCLNSSSFVYPTDTQKTISQLSKNKKILILMENFKIYHILLLYKLSQENINANNVFIATKKYLENKHIEQEQDFIKYKLDYKSQGGIFSLEEIHIAGLAVIPLRCL